MERIERSIEVGVPVSTAYNQWTQFEDFPKYMEGIEEVRQIDDKTVHWKAKIAGKEEEWDARITEQVPDKVIAWEGFGGADNRGRVFFEPLDGGARTRISVAIDYELEGFVEKVGDILGMIARRLEGDLERFQEFIEARGAETGAWRDEVHERPTGTG